MSDKQFWDSNLWIYLFVKSSDPGDMEKQRKIKALLATHPDLYVSAQVLNEVANVLMKKYGFDETQTLNSLTFIIKATTVLPLDEQLTLDALQIKARYQQSWFDSLIIAAGISARCGTLYSEDLQDQQQIEGMTILNPFHQPPHPT